MRAAGLTITMQNLKQLASYNDYIIVPQKPGNLVLPSQCYKL